MDQLDTAAPGVPGGDAVSRQAAYLRSLGPADREALLELTRGEARIVLDGREGAASVARPAADHRRAGPAVMFTRADLELFAAASGDRNPLHLDAGYARRSPYGEPVVYGVLGALAGLGALAPRPDRRTTSIQVAFPGPISPGVGYAVVVHEDTADGAHVELRDGRRAAVRLRLERTGAPARALTPGRGSVLRAEPAAWTLADLAVGTQRRGRWSVDLDAWRRLEHRFGLAQRGGDTVDRAVLALLSYLVGMEVPGRDALFSGFRLTLDAGGALSSPLPSPSAAVGDIDWTVTVAAVRAAVGHVALDVALSAGGAALGEGRVDAFLRQPVPPLDAAAVVAAAPSAADLTGAVAVVVGASRGLGAAVAAGLCARGAEVHGTFRSSDVEIAALATALADAGAPGHLVPVRGDAADPRFWAELRDRLVAHGRGLDVLVCNACPPLRPAWVEPEAGERIRDHVDHSLRLVLEPLTVLLPLLVAGDGRGAVVLVSSSAVTEPVAEWPHYVAAKRAIEGLAQVVAVEHPGLRVVVARPPRLLTDLVDSPLGRLGAVPPAAVAGWLVDAVVAARAEPAAPARPVVVTGPVDLKPS